jgi:hypothetical protein
MTAEQSSLSSSQQNESNELINLQSKVASLSSSFVEAYGGLVANLNSSVSMMQNVNGLMEQYVLNSINIGNHNNNNNNNNISFSILSCINMF